MILSTHLFYLLNLSTTPQFYPSLLLSNTFDVLDHIRQYNQPNTIRYLLCAIYYTRFTLHYALCTIHYAFFIMHYALCTMHYALFTIHYALCVYMYSYVFTILYVFIRIYYFIRIHTYLLFYMKIRRNPVILVLTRSSRRVE